MRYTLHIFTVLLLLLISCRDDLPVYQRPKDYFTLSLVSYDSSTVTYYTTDEPIPTVKYSIFGKDFQFVASIRDPDLFQGFPLSFGPLFCVTNVYEETIQASIDAKGSLEIWPKGMPQWRATIPMTNDDILPSSAFSPADNMLTIDPGEALYIQPAWNYKFDNGKWVHEAASFVQMYSIGYRFFMIEFAPLPMRMRLTVALDDKSAAFVVEASFLLYMRGKLYLAG